MKGRVLAIIMGFAFTWAMAQSNLDVVSSNILYINQEFAKYNPYNTMFRIDKISKKLLWYNEYGDREALLEDVEFRITDQFHIGVYCIDGDDCIDQSGGYKTDNYDMTYEDDDGNFPSSGYQIPTKFNEIKQELGVAIRTSMALSSTGIDYAKIGSNLEYINSKFALYNEYNTRFELNTTTGELKVKDKFGYIAMHISKFEFELDYEKQYFRVKSRSGRYELQNFDLSGNRKEKAYANYGLVLRYNDKLISDAPAMAAKLKEIREMYDINSAGYVNTAINYVNGMFDKYNEYSAQFGAEPMSKMMVFSNKFGTYKSQAADTEYRIDGNNFGVFCKGEIDCMLKYNDDGTRKYGSEIDFYTMGLRYEDSVIAEGIAVAEILSSVAQLVANGQNNSGGTNTYGNSIADRLSKINDLFTEHGQYQYNWSVDYTYKQLIGKSSYCTIKVNLNQLDNVMYYYNVGSSYPSGLKIVSDSKGINENCSGTQNYIDNKLYYLDTEVNARTVISEMLAIKEMVLE
ncbi:MAG: hypothetical protein ACPGLV_00540 [Bacteroidia bacterium]